MAESDAEVVRDTADDVLRQAKYAEPGPSLIERVVEWVFERLSDLLPDIGGGPSGDGGFVIGWILLIAAAALIGWLLFKVMPRRFRRRSKEEVVVTTETRVRTSRDEWLERAAEAEADGRFRDAVHARYRATVAGLLEREELPDAEGTTTGEYVEAFAAAPPRGPSFDEASGRYEEVWFGGADADRPEAVRMGDLDDVVLGGRGPEQGGSRP